MSLLDPKIHPRPWNVEAFASRTDLLHGAVRRIRVIDADGWPVKVGGRDLSYEVQDMDCFVNPLIADLKSLVAVVNAHDELVSACRWTLTALTSKDGNELTAEDAPMLRDALELADRAKE